MKTVEKIAAVTGVALLLSGCTTTPSATEKYPFDTNKRHIVQYYEDDYHYRPDHSWSYKLNKSSASLSAHMNNVASGGLLTCKENDIWFISINDRAEEKKIRYIYFISLSKSQLMEMEDNATYIPRRDSKEFKELIEIDTQMAEQGLIGCSEKIPKEKVEKIIPASDVVAI